MKHFFEFYLGFSLILWNGGHGARILGLFPFQGKSHFLMYEKIMVGLAQRGHHVDVYSHFPQKNPIPGYHDVKLQTSIELVNNVPLALIQDMNWFSLIKDVADLSGYQIATELIQTPEIIELKNSNRTKYDLVITEIFGTDFFTVFGYHFNAPMVALTSSYILPWASDRFGIPDNPSYIVNYLMSSGPEMSLGERFLNTISLINAKLQYYYYSTYPCDQLAREFLQDDQVSLETLTRNMSLMLVNSHWSITQARPLTPNVIEVGGIHIDDPKPLKGEIKNFVDEAPTGIIYFSMGSMVQPETFDRNLLEAIIGVFKEIPYKVLWKGDHLTDIEIPENVKIIKWIPQLDVLCDPNTILFITHGGMLGTQEAVHCGVPMLGIPIFADQLLNMRGYVDRGLAEIISFRTSEKNEIRTKILNLIEEPKYRENAKKVSRQFRDRPISALDTAMFWIEYVIRYRGAPEMRPSSTKFYWFQYYLLDLALVSMVVSVVGYKLVKFVVNLTIGMLFLSRNSKKVKRE